MINKYENIIRRGLPGGPNEETTYSSSSSMMYAKPLSYKGPNLNLKNYQDKKDITKFGFMVPDKRQGNIIVGGGLNFLPIGTQFNATGVIPLNSNPVFKGVGNVGVNKQLGDFNLGFNLEAPYLKNPITGKRMKSNVTPRLTLKYNFNEGGQSSIEGYKRNSPDVNNPFNIINSSNITMKDVEFPVYGVDDLGNSKIMMPGGEYEFPGNRVLEIPMAQGGTEISNQGMRELELGPQGNPFIPYEEYLKLLATTTTDAIAKQDEKNYNSRGRKNNAKPIPDAIFQGGGEEKGFFDAAYSYLNPYNWGVTDYTDRGSFDAAYAAAKAAGEKEFMYNYERFNTDYEGSQQEELDVYGIPYEQATQNNWLRNRIQQNINADEGAYGYDDYGGTPVYNEATGGYDLKDDDLSKIKAVVKDFVYGKSNIGHTGAYSEDEMGRLTQDIFNLYLGLPVQQAGKTAIKVSDYKSKYDPNRIAYKYDEVWDGLARPNSQYGLEYEQYLNEDGSIITDTKELHEKASKFKKQKGDISVQYYNALEADDEQAADVILANNKDKIEKIDKELSALYTEIDKIDHKYKNNKKQIVMKKGADGLSSFILSDDKVRQEDNYNLGRFALQKGEDEKGKYIEYYDIWDLHPTTQGKYKFGSLEVNNPANYLEQLGLAEDQSQGIGKPLHWYDRLYYTIGEDGNPEFENYNPSIINKPRSGGFKEGGEKLSRRDQRRLRKGKPVNMLNYPNKYNQSHDTDVYNVSEIHTTDDTDGFDQSFTNQGVFVNRFPDGTSNTQYRGVLDGQEYYYNTDNDYAYYGDQRIDPNVNLNEAITALAGYTKQRGGSNGMEGFTNEFGPMINFSDLDVFKPTIGSKLKDLFSKIGQNREERKERRQERKNAISSFQVGGENDDEKQEAYLGDLFITNEDLEYLNRRATDEDWDKWRMEYRDANPPTFYEEYGIPVRPLESNYSREDYFTLMDEYEAAEENLQQSDPEKYREYINEARIWDDGQNEYTKNKALNFNPYTCSSTSGCLAKSFDAYDRLIGQKYASEDYLSEKNLKESWGLASAVQYQKGYKEGWAYDKNTDKYVYKDITGNVIREGTDKEQKWFKDREHYFTYKRNGNTGRDFTADSWDIHGILIDQGGESLFTMKDKYYKKEGVSSKSFKKLSDEEKNKIYAEMTPGTIIGFGLNKKGYNGEKGLGNSYHSAQVVGWDERGVPVIFDYGKYVPIDGVTMYGLKGINNITIPKEQAGKNLEWNKKKGYYTSKEDAAKKTELDLDLSALYEAGGDQDELEPFYQGIKDNKAALMQDLGITSEKFDELAKYSVAIAMNETEGGSGGLHNTERVLYHSTDALDPLGLNEMITGSAGMMMGDTHGLSQLNLNNLKNDELLAPIAEKYGITEMGDLYDLEKNGIATVLYAYRNMLSARENYDKGKNLKSEERVRTYYPSGDYALESDLKMLIGKDAKYDGYQMQIEEKDENGDPIIIDFFTGNNATGIGWDKDLEDIQAQFDEAAPGKYRVYEDDQGRRLVDKVTQGNYLAGEEGQNTGDLSDAAIFAYNWNSPYSLTSGDAQGGSSYAKKFQTYLDLIQQKEEGGEIPEDVLSLRDVLSEQLANIDSFNLNPSQTLRQQQALYDEYNFHVAPKYKLGGPKLSKEFALYKNFIVGKDTSEKAQKNYDKLNRVYYKKAKTKNMSPANYIMTELIS